jgi:hypothetical protein
MAAMNGIKFRQIISLTERCVARALVAAPLLGVVLLTGCSSLSTLEVANQLETIPLGTPFSEMQDRIWEGVRKRVVYNQYPVVGEARYFIDTWVSYYDPNDKTYSPLVYRQWPAGILMDLENDDLFVSVAVKDNTFSKGGVFLFLSSDYKYKGYFTESRDGRCEDSKERMKKEKQNYRDMGFPLLIDGARKRNNSADGFFLPDLPLRNYLPKKESAQ